MPNPLVPAAPIGLPLPRPDLADLMRAAHAACHFMPIRLPYADRFALALRRAWAAAKASALRLLRAAVEARVERLMAFLDALNGDVDLEPSLAGGYYPPLGHALDAELDTADNEPSLGSLECVDQERWNEGGSVDHEECPQARRVTRHGEIGRGNAPMRATLAPRRSGIAFDLPVVS